jgi:hypothetical protein
MTSDINLNGYAKEMRADAEAARANAKRYREREQAGRPFVGNHTSATYDQQVAHFEAVANLAEAAPGQNALLIEALDLVPRINKADPMSAALEDWCNKVRACIAKTINPEAKA